MHINIEVRITHDTIMSYYVLITIAIVEWCMCMNVVTLYVLDNEFNM